MVFEPSIILDYEGGVPPHPPSHKSGIIKSLVFTEKLRKSRERCSTLPFVSAGSPSSRAKLDEYVMHKGGVICISEVVDISPGNLDSSLYFIQPTFHIIFSAYNLNKKGDNIQP